jgi:peptidoglycan/LPS O-acetylase OafA/YrhL
LLWEGYSEGYLRHPDEYGPAGKLLVFLASAFKWGNAAVIFFFVLSGFVIHLGYARRLLAEGPRARFDFGPYIRRRARRLYPPFLLALLLTWALDTWGRRLQLPLHHGLDPLLLNRALGFDHRLKTAVRNLVFITNPVFGSDGPLWSLNYEAYFYLLYPAVFAIARRSWQAATIALVALSLLGFAPIWPGSLLWLRGVFQLMIVWWFGALLAERFAGRFALGYGSLSGLILAFLALPLWRWDPNVPAIVLGLAFTGLLAACFGLQESGRAASSGDQGSFGRWTSLGSRVVSCLANLRPLGAMSYTLYVIHFPILVFMSGCLTKARGGTLPGHLGWAALGICLCVLIAWLFHFLVERPFTRQRERARSPSRGSGR